MLNVCLLILRMCKQTRSHLPLCPFPKAITSGLFASTVMLNLQLHFGVRNRVLKRWVVSTILCKIELVFNHW